MKYIQLFESFYYKSKDGYKPVSKGSVVLIMSHDEYDICSIQTTVASAKTTIARESPSYAVILDASTIKEGEPVTENRGVISGAEGIIYDDYTASYEGQHVFSRDKSDLTIAVIDDSDHQPVYYFFNEKNEKFDSVMKSLGKTNKSDRYESETVQNLYYDRKR